MKRYSKDLDYVQRSVDIIIVFSSWMLAYYLRFVCEIGGPVSTQLFNFYLAFGCLLSVITLITYKNAKLYDAMRLESQSKEIATQLKAHVLSFLIFLVMAFFISQYRLSRIMLVIYFSVSALLLIFSKLYFRKLFTSRPMKFVLVGNGQSAIAFYKKIKSLKNIQILNWTDGPSEIDQSIPTSTQLDLPSLEKEEIDGLVIGYDNDKSAKSSSLMEKLSDFLIPIIFLPDVSFAKVGYSMTEFKGQPLIYLNEPNVKQFGLIIKRVFDFTATLIGCLILFTPLLIIAIIIKLTSKGPIFYSQIRMGVDGKEFKMWKFRSMITGEANKETWTVENDPRVTKIGRFIRKKNIDELPQLINILKGDMSLVGPRPERPQYVEEFRDKIPGYMVRHKFKAGLTGWAQVNGWRGDTSIEKRIECDLWYIKNWSFGLDIAIIFMTLFKGNKNAY